MKVFLLLLAMLCPLCSNALEYYTNEEYPGVLLITGLIIQGDIGDFKNQISENDIHTVMMNSDGGNLVTSIEMGYYIRENNIRTIVPENGSCYSACTYAFMGGVERSIDGDAPFAMHRPYLSEEVEGTYNNGYKAGILTSVMVTTYLIEMGLDPLTATLHLLNEQLAHFSKEQQKNLNIITARI